MNGTQNSFVMTLVKLKGWSGWSYKFWWLHGILALGFVVTGDCRQSPQTAHGVRDAGASSSPGLPRLSGMAEHELTQLDIAQVNRACGSGLSTELSAGNHPQELDRMADRTRSETERNLHRYTGKPDEFHNSPPFFRMLCLVTVLQQDFGVCYHPDRAKPNSEAVEPNETFYGDPTAVFLSGLMGPARVGTCASLPVLYVAVGRRLGYPMKLVATRNHLFVRWDDGTTHLNIEATSSGLVVFDDDYFRSWPFPISPEEELRERCMVSLSPREELGVFLSLRAHCLTAVGRFREAVEAQREMCLRFSSSQIHAGFLRELERKA